MAMLTLAVVVASAVAGWRFLPVPPASGAEAKVVETEEPSYLAMGRDYYVHVKLIELTPRRPGGGKWEPRGASAPDICFNLYWNGTRVFEGSEREDRLIGEWDLLRLDLKDALLSGQVEVAAAVNAPIIHAEAGGVLTLEIWDEDVSFNDEAGRLELAVEELHPGLNTLTPEGSGVARVVIDMVPRDTPLPDLLERASNR
jgi:hypothetical protein